MSNETWVSGLQPGDYFGMWMRVEKRLTMGDVVASREGAEITVPVVRPCEVVKAGTQTGKPPYLPAVPPLFT
jgi:hypothetical protein